MVIAFRNLMKNKMFSMINTLGLAIGMASCLLILQYVSFEHSYDDFHDKAENIYRVRHDRNIDGELQYRKAQSFVPTGQAMKSEYPEVLDYTTLFEISDQSDIIVSHQKEGGDVTQFSEKNIFHASGNFLNIFSLSIISGRNDLDSVPLGTVFISQSMATKYFGEESPINKTISHNYTKEDHKIIGVFEDLPSNSHIKINFLFPWTLVTGSIEKDNSNWHWDGFYTYLLLSDGTDSKDLQAKFPQFIEKYMAGRRNQMADSKFYLQPLEDIHLHSDLLGELAPNGNGNIVRMLLLLSIFILVIAWINYVNLSTARSIDRAREIGIRKVVGSSRLQLIRQFMIESLLVNFLACLISLTIVQLLSSSYYQLTGQLLELQLLLSVEFWILFLILFLSSSATTGLYPAFILSSHQPVSVLKGCFPKVERGRLVNLRKGLVIFQFAVSLILITGSIMIYKQIAFMQGQQLGIDIEETLVLKTHAQFGPVGADSLFLSKVDVLKSMLSTQSKINGITASYDLPGREHKTNIPHFRHIKNNEEFVSLYYSRIDVDFLPTFKVQIVAGRNFSKEMVTDNRALIINMEALAALGFDKPEDAIDYEVTSGNTRPIKSKIIGVVDFRSTSFKEQNYPVVYQTHWAPMIFLSIKLNNQKGDELNRTISSVRKNWEEVFPDKPFEYFFLDDLFDEQYREEQRLSKVLMFFTALAITIACLGLYGLSLITIVRKTKEIGVRKVMGASVQSLLKLVSKDFLILALIAGIISLPINWYLLKKWLENYAYRAEMSWSIYALPILFLLALMLITICHQVIKATLASPVDSLKYE